MSESVAALVVASAALVMGLAGAAKLANPQSFRSTLTSLGAPHPNLVASLVAIFEVGASQLLVWAASTTLAAVVTAGLGLVFALAGLRALMLPHKVSCACFGRNSKPLGTRQLLALPLWILVAASCLSLSSGRAVTVFAASGFLVFVVTLAVRAVVNSLELRSHLREWAAIA